MALKSGVRVNVKPQRGRRKMCGKKVLVLDKTTGKLVELEPIKVWSLGPKGRVKIKIGLFRSPETGKYFRARVPDDCPSD